MRQGAGRDGSKSTLTHHVSRFLSHSHDKDHRITLVARLFEGLEHEVKPVEATQVGVEQVGMVFDGEATPTFGVGEGALPAAQRGVGVKVRQQQQAAGPQDAGHLGKRRL